jgi:hypothetical protein
MTLEQTIAQMRTAENLWRQTLTQHRLAPPDDGFSGRLLDQADACRKQQDAYARAAQTPGLGWDPLPPAARRDPPYELRADSGRRGPLRLWSQFDDGLAELNKAFEGPSLKAIADAFGALAEALDALGEAVAEEDGRVRRAQAASR